MSPRDNSRPGLPGRFTERAATQTLKSARPDLRAGLAAIRNTLDTLGPEPGVYRMLDEGNNVLYVGKARNLRNRVANYTQLNGLPKRKQRMVAQTRRMVIIVTRSEAEALLLEAQLIKRFRPPYNVLLRDDKSFPYIALDMSTDFPRLSKHRGARKPNVRYFGPFASAGAVNTTLNALQKVFLLRSCTDSYMANRSRPCLLYQIGRCSAPCVAKLDKAAYAELVEEALQFLTGKSQQVQKKLADRMAAASATQDYELAAVFRDRLRALTTIQGTQAVNAANDAVDADVIAIHRHEGLTGIQIFFIRSGQNWGHRAIFPQHAGDIAESEVLSAFLAQFYAELPPAPLLLLDRELPDAELLAEALSAQASHKVEIRTPRRGHLRRLVEQAVRNAEDAVDRRLAESTTLRHNLQALADLFALPGPPERIEIYDNSHIQGSNALGAMVVATPAGFQKSQYRKFNMKSAELTPGDDYAMMKAMLTRRFARLKAESESAEDDANWPDLLLIDGGRGQVDAVLAALEDLHVEDMPVVGIAQGPNKHATREIFHLADGRELVLPPNDPLLFFLQRLRDEAHRFAIGAHRRKRSKALTVSTLDDVPGIGPKRKKSLLMYFGSARAVKAAALEDIMKAPGISRATAEAIYGHFHPQRSS